MTPAVSVIVPTFDRLAYLREAVGSVLAQTTSDWELIVIDDGSTDDTVAWLESCHDPRISVIRKEHTGHPSFLRNIGIALARAEWIAFLDSDDRWMPEKLERQLAFHTATSRFRWSYTLHMIIDADGVVRDPALFKAQKPYSGFILRELLLLDAIISLPSVMVERSLLREVGGFDETLRFAEDYDLWVKLARHFEIGVVDEPLTVVRTHRSTSYDRAEVDEGYMSIYRRMASSPINGDLRRIARNKEGYYAIWAANKWATQGEWRRALYAASVAIRRRPFSRGAYRAGARLVWRMMKTFTRGARVPVRAP